MYDLHIKKGMIIIMKSLKIKIIGILCLLTCIIIQYNVYAANQIKEQKDVTMIVTQDDETEKKYSLSIIETENKDIKNVNLKTLYVEGYDLYPELRKNTHRYNLTISEDIKILQVFAEPENKNATIEIIGNDNLKKGNNTIKIIVTAEDGITKGEYIINTY